MQSEFGGVHATNSLTNLGLREGCDFHRFRFDDGVIFAHNITQMSAVVEKIMASTFVTGQEKNA